MLKSIYFFNFTNPTTIIMKPTRSSVCYLLFIVFNLLGMSYQHPETEEECQLLIEMASASIEKSDYVNAYKYLARADAMAKKNKWEEKLFFIKNWISKIYVNTGNYGQAMGCYLDALEIANKNPSLEKELPLILTNIGNLYFHEQDYNTALSYYKKAVPLAKKTKDNYNTALVAINIAGTYNQLGNYDESYKSLESVRELEMPELLAIAWKLNYAEAYMYDGKLSHAEKIIDELSVRVQEKEEMYVNLMDISTKLLMKQNKIDLAVSVAKKGLKTTQPKEKVDFYGYLSDLYLKKKNYSNALKYKDSLVIAKDSLSAVVNRGLFESNKVKQKIWEYQKESEVSKERLAAERKLFYTILVAFVAIVTVIILFLRQKRLAAEQNKQMMALELEKEMNENLLLEKEIKEKETNALLEQERLKSEIEARNRKISAKALFLSDRNRLIDDILQSISNIPELINNTFLTDKISALKSYLKNDNEWDDFIAHFEEVNPGLLHKLKSMHPSLSANDMRFIAYIYMNLSVKEISGLLNITYEACKKRKERIMSKMELQPDISLYDYISAV